MGAMPSIVRLARLATSPAARGLLVATLRSPTARDFARRGVADPRGLARDLSHPRTLREIGGAITSHPAVRGIDTFVTSPDELPAALRLARAGLVLLPLRYMPAAWIGLWATRRLTRRRRAGPSGR